MSTVIDYPRQRRMGAARFLPLLGWLPESNRGTLRADTVAGLTVGVMLIPQSLAYATLAGLPPVTGLYASIVPLVVYALLGSSGTLAVGPVAVVSMMTAAALAPLADGDPTRYAGLAALLALLVGAIQVAMGAFRLGAVVTFLSHPVLTGFITASATLIVVSQVPGLLGLDASGSGPLPEALPTIAGALSTVNGQTVAVSVVAVTVLLVLKRAAPRVPGALIVVVALTAVSAALGLDQRGVAVLGEVPTGLPAPALPVVTLQEVTSLLPAALAIALVGYTEGVAVAKSLGSRSGQHVSPDGELVAVGAANASAGLFGGLPVAGGFARSAVSFSAGARTPLSSLVSAAVVALTALVLTPLVTALPMAVLAVTIVVAVAGLVDWRDMVSTWRTRRADGLALAVTFLTTLVFGVETGIAAGVIFSLAVLLWRSSRPHTAELGRVPGTGVFRNLARYDELETVPEVAVVRVDAPMVFANAERVADTLRRLVDHRPRTRTVVLDASAIGDCDCDGAHALGGLRRELGERGITLRLATVRGPVRDLLDRDGVWPELVATGHVHADTASAVAAAQVRAQEPGPMSGIL